MQAFENAYGGTPTWEIGRPQRAVIRLVEAGLVEGSVLDLGCGTGDTALYLGGLGHAVVGVDFAPSAIAKAIEKLEAGARPDGAGARPDGAGARPDGAGTLPDGAATPPDGAGACPEDAGPPRRFDVAFVVADALHLPDDLGGPFDTALDVGLFHTLQPHDRKAYAAGVRAALRPRGRCLVLAWSDRNPFGYGPERVRRRDLRAAFRDGWQVETIEAESLETLLPQGTVHAWLGRFRRIG